MRSTKLIHFPGSYSGAIPEKSMSTQKTGAMDTANNTRQTAGLLRNANKTIPVIARSVYPVHVICGLV